MERLSELNEVRAMSKDEAEALVVAWLAEVYPGAELGGVFPDGDSWAFSAYPYAEPNSEDRGQECTGYVHESAYGEPDPWVEGLY